MKQSKNELARSSVPEPMRPPPDPSVVQALRDRIQRLEGGAVKGRTVLPFGVAAVDARLPGGGLALGALHEVAGGGVGAVDGAAAALFSAGVAARTRGRVLWCVTRPDLFAPGAGPSRPAARARHPRRDG